MHFTRGNAMRTVLCLFILVLAGCGKKTEPAAAAAPPEMPPVSVRVVDVIERQEAEWQECIGRLEAVEFVEVRPRVEGFIDAITVSEGADVKAGDALFTIDPRSFEIQIKRAQAQVDDAQARLDVAKKNHTRSAELIAAHAISSEEAEQRAWAVEAGQAALQSAEAALAAAQLDLSFAKVTAPIAGRVGRAAITAGNLAGPSRGAVLTLVAYDPIYAAFDLEERVWNQARALLMADNAPALEVGLDGEQGWPHAAKLAFADNHIDPATGTIRLRAKLDNADGALTPGAYARIRVPIAPATARLFIDQRAIGTDQTNKFVYTIADGRAAYRPVTLGPAVGDTRIVRSGLQSGEQVILDLAKIFFPGMKVTVAEPEQPKQ
jgi:multidrug efflux system membrane fusion protein